MAGFSSEKDQVLGIIWAAVASGNITDKSDLYTCLGYDDAGIAIGLDNAFWSTIPAGLRLTDADRSPHSPDWACCQLVASPELQSFTKTFLASLNAYAKATTPSPTQTARLGKFVWKSFAGIAPHSAPAFIAAHFVGCAGWLCRLWLAVRLGG